MAAPITERFQATIPAASAAVAQDQVVAESHVAGKVTAVSFTPEANITAHATNYRTFRLLNKGQSGAGSTVIASFATDTVTTDDLTAFDEKQLTLSSTAADLVVAVGDILAWDETVAASGVATSGGRVEIEIARTS
jgi:hypothetical protein